MKHPGCARELASLAAALTLLLAAGTSRAQAAGYTLEFAPGACPFDESFAQEVKARKRTTVRGPDARVRVSVSGETPSYVARMELERDGFATTTREFAAADCDEARSALATVVAIALDALVEPPTPPEPAPVVSADAPEPEPVAKPSQPHAPAASWSTGVGLHLDLDLSLAPQPAFGGGVVGSLSQSPAGLGMRLGGFYRTNPSASAAGRTFAVTLIGGGFELCPWAFRPAARVSLAPCAGLEAGRYRAEGTRGFDRSVPRSSFWATAELLGRAGLDLGEGVWWELSAHLLLPFQSRMSLVADVAGESRQIELFDASAASALVSTGVKLEFQ